MVGYFIGLIVTLTTNFYRSGADDVTRAIRLWTVSKTMDFDKFCHTASTVANVIHP